MPEINGILLAAGLSRRFGSDKRLHQLPDGRRLAQAAAIALQAGVIGPWPCCAPKMSL